ncbi:MAG TPA: hypothetical protein VFA01_09320 [Candidatus Dormibacteraeota bacterium]|nr:hypothetical protein [Candidatus Dormibacteraeota bacterium]
MPLAGGIAFGLGPLLLPQTMAEYTGFAGNDPLVGRYAGAATLGYAVALAVGIAEGRARPLRLVVLATLVFNLASLFACVLEIVAGSPRPVVYVILIAGVVITVIAALVLRAHREPAAGRDVGAWVVPVLAILTALAAVFGLLPLLAPQQFAALFGQHGTDTFVFRQAGAATLGYAAMGVAEVRAAQWELIRLPIAMALAFNAAAFAATLYHLAAFAEVNLLTVLVAPASLFATVATALILVRGGR